MNFVHWLKAQGDRVAGWTGIAVGGVMILSGWIATSGTRAVSDQIPYLVSGGLGGLFFVAVGVALLVRADMHDEWSKLDSVEQTLRSLTLPPTPESVVELRDHRSSPGRTAETASRGPRQAEPVLAVSLGAGPAPATPITSRQEAGTATLALAGALVLVWGWFTVSGTRHVPDALSDSSLAVAGLTLVAGAVGLHSFGLRRATGRRTARLFGSLVTAGEPQVAEVGDDRPAGRYVVDGSRRFHRAGCPVLATQSATAVHPATTVAQLVPCRLCDAPADHA